jgi:hypothetical protein
MPLLYIYSLSSLERSATLAIDVELGCLQKTNLKRIFSCFSKYASAKFKLSRTTFNNRAGLPDFSWNNVPKPEKIYQTTTKYTKNMKYNKYP